MKNGIVENTGGQGSRRKQRPVIKCSIEKLLGHKENPSIIDRKVSYGQLQRLGKLKKA